METAVITRQRIAVTSCAVTCRRVAGASAGNLAEMPPETTGPHHDTPRPHRGPPPGHPTLWVPGQSGNPAGRPKGSRNKLAEAFYADLYAKWQLKGPEAIDKMIETDPGGFVKVIASVMPKEFNVRTDDGMNDEQIDNLIEAIRLELDKRQQAHKLNAMKLINPPETHQVS